MQMLRGWQQCRAMEDCSTHERLRQETLCCRQWTDEYVLVEMLNSITDIDIRTVKSWQILYIDSNKLSNRTVQFFLGGGIGSIC